MAIGGELKKVSFDTKGVIPGKGGDAAIQDGWGEQLRQQQMASTLQRRRENAAYRATLDEARGNVEAELTNARDKQMRANLAGFDMAYGGNGVVPMSAINTLSGEFSDAGIQYGGGKFFNDKKGGRYFVSAGITGDGQKVYNRMSLIDALREDTRLGGGNLSDATVDNIYGELKKSGMTDEQIMRATGYSPDNQRAIREAYYRANNGDQDSIVSRVTGGAGGRDVGGVTMSGSVARALFGRGGDNRSRISVFATDGKGGFTRSEYDGHTTGEQPEENGGTRDPNYQGRWKVLQSGPDGVRYENDKTGEVIDVPKGKNLREVLTEAMTPKGRNGNADYIERELLRQAGAREELKDRQLKFIQSEILKMRRAKRKGVVGEEPAFTDDQIAERENELYNVFGLEKPQKSQTPVSKSGQEESSRVDNIGDETRKDKNGVTWRIIRDKNGKAIGKQRVE